MNEENLEGLFARLGKENHDPNSEDPESENQENENSQEPKEINFAQFKDWINTDKNIQTANWLRNQKFPKLQEVTNGNDTPVDLRNREIMADKLKDLLQKPTENSKTEVSQNCSDKSQTLLDTVKNRPKSSQCQNVSESTHSKKVGPDCTDKNLSEISQNQHVTENVNPDCPDKTPIVPNTSGQVEIINGSVLRSDSPQTNCPDKSKISSNEPDKSSRDQKSSNLSGEAEPGKSYVLPELPPDYALLKAVNPKNPTEIPQNASKAALLWQDDIGRMYIFPKNPACHTMIIDPSIQNLSQNQANSATGLNQSDSNQSDSNQPISHQQADPELPTDPNLTDQSSESSNYLKHNKTSREIGDENPKTNSTKILVEKDDSNIEDFKPEKPQKSTKNGGKSAKNRKYKPLRPSPLTLENRIDRSSKESNRIIEPKMPAKLSLKSEKRCKNAINPPNLDENSKSQENPSSLEDQESDQVNQPKKDHHCFKKQIKRVLVMAKAKDGTLIRVKELEPVNTEPASVETLSKELVSAESESAQPVSVEPIKSSKVSTKKWVFFVFYLAFLTRFKA